jgi:hypothetical protein
MASQFVEFIKPLLIDHIVFPETLEIIDKKRQELQISDEQFSEALV